MDGWVWSAIFGGDILTISDVVLVKVDLAAIESCCLGKT